MSLRDRFFPGPVALASGWCSLFGFVVGGFITAVLAFVGSFVFLSGIGFVLSFDNFGLEEM